jgi:hypothetical protein
MRFSTSGFSWIEPTNSTNSYPKAILNLTSNLLRYSNYAQWSKVQNQFFFLARKDFKHSWCMPCVVQFNNVQLPA